MKQALVIVYPFDELSSEAKDKAWKSYKGGLCPYSLAEYGILANQFGWYYHKDGPFHGDILSDNQGKSYPEWEKMG